MSVLEELRTLGVDIDDGLKRLNGNEKLYTRLLGKFVDSLPTRSARILMRLTARGQLKKRIP